MKKKIIAAAGFIVAICFTVLLVNYVDNENNLKEYENGEYSIRNFDDLGFTQPYIEPYNEGCMYYQEGDYEKAINKFREALEKNPDHNNDVECNIRVNLALSMIAPIDMDSVSEDNKDAIRVVIKEAKNVLCEEECAHMDDEDGHNKEAQKLKDELDNMEQQLDQNQNEGDDPQSPQQDPGEEPDDPKEDPDGDKTKERLIDIQKEGDKVRGTDITDPQPNDPFSYDYDKPSW